MRTHEGNQPEANHQVYSDEDTMRKFGRLTNIYKDLYDVRVEAVQANTNIGINSHAIITIGQILLQSILQQFLWS